MTATSDRLLNRIVGADLETLVRPWVRLAPHTTLRVGGPAEWYCEPSSPAEMERCLYWASQRGLALTVLGAGSNLLISDAGLLGLVVNTRKLRGIRAWEDGRIWAGAGEPMVKLARLAAERGWSGLEWAIGVPGTVGGAVAMNAGAHGMATADVLSEALVFDESNQQHCLSSQELQFGYRFSLLQQRAWVVSGALWRLEPDQDPVTVAALTQEHWQQRRRSQPYDLPSCGSVFRNPYPHTAGWLIEQTGLKGYQIGGAQVSYRHANFILNCGHATATDIYMVLRHVQEQVHEQWSLLLEPEVRILGDFSAASCSLL